MHPRITAKNNPFCKMLHPSDEAAVSSETGGFEVEVEAEVEAGTELEDEGEATTVSSTSPGSFGSRHSAIPY